MSKIIMEAMEAAISISKESNFINPLIGFEFSKAGYGINIKLFTLKLKDLSYKAIDDFLTKEYGNFSFSGVQMLEGEEWEEGRYSFSIFNTWGKIQKLIKDNNIKDDGQYVIVNSSNNTTVEVSLYNTHPWINSSELTIKSEQHKKAIEKIGLCGKASDLEIIFIPDFHMWKVETWDTYPDDPGCGIYSIAVNVFDKATNERLVN